MAKARLSLIHETLSDGRHRLVRYEGTRSGTLQTVGEWAGHHELAILGRHRANSGSIPHLPVGIFRVSNVGHDVLHG